MNVVLGLIGRLVSSPLFRLAVPWYFRFFLVYEGLVRWMVHRFDAVGSLPFL